MCDGACIEFAETRLTSEEIQGKSVIDVGAMNVNGSVRAVIESLGPSSYLGVDVASGPGVDEICDINDLVATYGTERFDVVVTTELLEHVRNWRGAVANLKRILKPNGVLLLTTRSRPFPYHGYPFDFWRYEVEDMEVIFSDLEIEAIERDPLEPGVFVKATKPVRFSEANLEDVNMYSVIRGRRCRDISESNILLFKARRLPRRVLSRVLPARAKAGIKRVLRPRATA